MQSPTPEPPAHLSEKVFRRFEQTIKQIVEEFPRTIIITPEGISQYTFIARLRDAMRSLYKYEWQTSVESTRFRSIRAQIVVKTGPDGTIIVCTTSTDTAPISVSFAPVASDDLEMFTDILTDIPIATISHLARIRGIGAIHPVRLQQSLCKVADVSFLDLEKLRRESDIEVLDQPPYYIIL